MHKEDFFLKAFTCILFFFGTQALSSYIRPSLGIEGTYFSGMVASLTEIV